MPKAFWLNDRDQYLQPKVELPNEFIVDCAIWNLFSGSNQTAAIRNIKYDGRVYHVDNHFFPFLKSEVKTWKITDSDIQNTITSCDDRFMALWLAKQNISNEAQAVLAQGRAVWKFYFEHLNELRTPKFKIETWDAGWWQVRNALNDQNLADDLLKDLKSKHDLLKAKLLPLVYEYGFLSR
jgi:hypothetical protein